MITLQDYFGPRWDHPEATNEKKEAARALLVKVNALLAAAAAQGAYLRLVDADTGTCISGSKGGSGDGGFRLTGSATGAVNSKHKLARAVDVFDPANTLDDWLTDDVLAQHGLYREAPDATPGWCHLQDLAPGSGRHTFNP